MKTGLALDVGVCGALLVGLSLLAGHLGPHLSRALLAAVTVAGGLCIAWASLTRLGMRCRRLILFTLTGGIMALVPLVVRAWQQVPQASGDQPVGTSLPAVVVTLMLVFALGQTLLVAGDKPPSREDSPDAPGRPDPKDRTGPG
jgi:hypothetical protein